MSFYELQAPTDWITAPGLWSHSLVEGIQACPRKWQLRSSRWGELELFPVRPSPAAVEGHVWPVEGCQVTHLCAAELRWLARSRRGRQNSHIEAGLPHLVNAHGSSRM